MQPRTADLTSQRAGASGPALCRVRMPCAHVFSRSGHSLAEAVLPSRASPTVGSIPSSPAAITHQKQHTLVQEHEGVRVRVRDAPQRNAEPHEPYCRIAAPPSTPLAPCT